MRYASVPCTAILDVHAVGGKYDKEFISWNGLFHDFRIAIPFRHKRYLKKNIGEIMTWAEAFYNLGKEFMPILGFATPILLGFMIARWTR